MRNSSSGEQRARRARGGCVWRAIKIGFVLLLAVVFVPIIVALVGVGVQCRPWGSPPAPDAPVATADVPAEIQAIKDGIPDYTREEDRTYLTLPEWYIVYSADELAALTAEHPPSSFPYFRAIGQFWDGYYDACAVTREQYAFNGGMHLTLGVIGASFTVENTLRGVYENTVGRVTELLSDGGDTEEDMYAQAVAAEYGTFLHTVPWYEFPFGEKLRGLWSETGAWGPNIVRKWERKLALSFEYGVKAGYGWLIKQATGAVYDADEQRIYTWAGGIDDEILAAEPEVQLVEPAAEPDSIVTLPRYEPFTQIVPRLVARGVEWNDLAGNDEIMVTLIGFRDWNYDLSVGRQLFEMPVLIDDQRKRIAVNVPVRELHQLLAEIGSRGAQLEHIYDY